MYDNNYAANLKNLPNYGAQHQLPSLVRWRPAEGGHELILKNSGELFISVAVVQIFNYKLNCAPNGNHVNKKCGSLENVKFQFYGGRAADSNFGQDFKRLFTNLESIQNSIAVTKTCRDMLQTDTSEKMVHFARSVFEKRVHVYLHTPRHIQISPTKIRKQLFPTRLDLYTTKT